MLQRWRSLSFLLLGLILLPFAHANGPFENTGIVRTVELGGSIVHTTTTFNVKALENGVDAYAIALGPNETATTSWIEATVKGQKDLLKIENLGLDPERCGYSKKYLQLSYKLPCSLLSNLYFLGVTLPAPLEKGATLNLVLETVQTHATRPWPETARQQDDQALKYDLDLLILSPYHTVVQRTKIR
jgi:oligosaccharyltransferase complex subunit alpha (ribophorin I)